VGAASTFVELMAMWKGFFVVWQAFSPFAIRISSQTSPEGDVFCEEKVSQKAEKFFSLEREIFVLIHEWENSSEKDEATRRFEGEAEERKFDGKELEWGERGKNWGEFLRQEFMRNLMTFNNLKRKILEYFERTSTIPLKKQKTV
jgi:hypothetical protein